MFFCFNNELSECNESDCRNQWTQAFTESNEFGKAMRHVHVGRFVIFVERLRSLSCLVYLLYLLHSLFNNIALQWKICHLQAKHAISCSAPFRFRHHLTHGRWVSISMPLPAKPVDFTRQSPCLCPPISMLLKGGFWIFCQRVGFQIVACIMQEARLAIPCVRDEKHFEVESTFLIYIVIFV